MLLKGGNSFWNNSHPRLPAVCTAVALPLCELPVELHARLTDRVYDREGKPEFRFDWRSSPTLLPVWWCGRLHLARWGNRDRAERRLPPTGWTWRESVESGKWAHLEPDPVEIPAGFMWTNGVWIKLKQGVRGLVVKTPKGEPVVYVICEPATRYYKIMTRDEWMPVLIGEVI